MQKMTDEQRMSIYAAYWNSPVTYVNPIGVSKKRKIDGMFLANCYSYKDIAIHLRPVSSLTDEELFIISKMCGLLTDDSTALFKKKWMKYVKEQIINGDGTDSRIVDLLRLWNIITTVHGFDLVAEGIAIVDDKNESI